MKGKGSFRDFVSGLGVQMLTVKRRVSKNLELAAVMKAREDTPVLAPEVEGSRFSAVGNVFATRELVAQVVKL